MWDEKITKPFLVIYGTCLFLATFFIVPTITSFYYYAWGKHLAWSYFDGPPMIAYFFHISHAIFGNTFFSINCVGFICLIVGAIYICRAGCLLQNRQTGLVSALIWLALPTTTESIFLRVLYDAPLNLFTILTFYYVARYILDKHTGDLYLSAFFIGAMLLSKYTAGVTLIALFLYLVFSKQRHVFKKPHFYLALLLIFIMVSPVLYWNIKHHWVSITYLLNFHSQTQNHSSVIHSLLALVLALAANYSVFLVLTALGWIKYKNAEMHSKNSVLELNYALLFLSLLFWISAIAFGGNPRVVYLTPLGMNIALASGYLIVRYEYHRFFKICYPLFLCFSLAMIAVDVWPIADYLKKSWAYSLIKKAVAQPGLIKKGQPLVAGYYTNAAVLSFFRPDEPVYVIPCGDINQYQYWSKPFLKDLVQGKIEKITYVDFKETRQCAEHYFNQCRVVAALSRNQVIPMIHKVIKPLNLYVYECSLPRSKGANV